VKQKKEKKDIRLNGLRGLRKLENPFNPGKSDVKSLFLSNFSMPPGIADEQMSKLVIWQKN
jgi:hypothetical protein